MIKKSLEGTWLIHDVHTDTETGFLIGETDRYFGTLSEAVEQTYFHKNTQQLKFEFISDKDETSL